MGGLRLRRVPAGRRSSLSVQAGVVARSAAGDLAARTPHRRIPEPGTIRAGRIAGRPVHDPDGRLLGNVADLITETEPDGSEHVVSAYVAKRPWGRLLGYERDRATGPRLLEVLARRILRRNATVVPFTDLGSGRPDGARRSG